jgi:methylmalonyl-CoA mutase N-terminal domain/subunit
MRLVTDTIQFGAGQTPRFNPISISGYHIREAGSTALQELAFTLRDGMEYADWAIERGMAIDDFAPRFSFFFNAHNDFFEEIAKYRAARKLWAELMRERYGARDERSLKLRFHAQTAGCSLTWQQPYNNVVRTTLQAMARRHAGAAHAAGDRIRERHYGGTGSFRRKLFPRASDCRTGTRGPRIH